MTQSIKQAAEAYVPKSAKNITELQAIDVAMLVREEKGTDSNGEPYTYNYIEIDGERYRIPDSVLKDLKTILQKKPDLRQFSVSKSGEGRLTRYTVIPL